MFIIVDLPEPEAPMMATKSPFLDRVGHAAQGADLRLPNMVGLGQILQLDDFLVHDKSLRRESRAYRPMNIMPPAGPPLLVLLVVAVVVAPLAASRPRMIFIPSLSSLRVISV